MKRFSFVFVLFLALPALAQQWGSAGLQTNPLVNAVLAEVVNSGADNALHWKFTCSSTVAATVVFEHRDAANAANVHAQGYFLTANQPFTDSSGVPTTVLFSGERFRIRLNAAITGLIWCSVLTD